MSNTYQPESLHPYIINDRLKKATGSGGISNIPIASSDTVGGIMIGGSANPITITGSGNASVRKATAELLGVVKAGDGVSIDSDGAISGVAYSTTEHKIGRKSADGKDIYEKSVIATDVTLTTSTVIDAIFTTASVDTVEKIVGTMKDSDDNIFENYMYYDAGQLLRATPILTSSGLTLLINGLTIKAYNITVQYTKQTTP